MPQVPIYKRQVQETGIPGVSLPQSQPLEAFGGGQGLQNTVNAGRGLMTDVADIMLKEKLKADEIATQDAELRLAQRQSKRESELAGFRGMAAAGAPDTIKPAWNSDLAEIRESLSNDNQKAAFDRRSLARTLQLNDVMQKHVAGEISRFDKENTDATIDLAQRDAAVHSNDRTRIETSIMQQAKAIREFGGRNGKGENEIVSEINDAVKSTHIGVIDRRISEYDFDGAEAYLNETEDILADGDKVRALRGYIESGREKLKNKTKIDNAELMRDLYMRAIPGSQDPLTYKEIDNLIRNNEIDVADHKTLSGMLTKVFDDPRLPIETKAAKQYEIAKKFTELNEKRGFFSDTKAEVDPEKLLPVGPTTGNNVDQVKEFRKFVVDNSEYLTEQQLQSYLTATHIDLNDDDVAKSKLFANLAATFKNLNVTAPGIFMAPFMKTMGRDTPIEKTVEAYNQAKEKAVVASNPLKTRFVEGQVYTSPKDGRDYRCLGHKDDGTPRMEGPL